MLYHPIGRCNARPAARCFWNEPTRVRDRKPHKHRIARMLLILDLRLRQRRLLHHAPHHRLRAAIQQPIARIFVDFARDLRFRRKAHRGVRMVPIAEAAEPLELLALHVQPMLGVGPTFLPERDHRLRVAKVWLGETLGAVMLLLDLPFNRQPVAIPTGYIIAVPPQHLLRAHDQIFQRLVERGADMDVAVGVGRPVVQHEFRPSRRRLAQLPVNVLSRPARQNFRLLLRQAATHRKIRFGQIKGRRIINRFGHGAGSGEARAIEHPQENGKTR